MAPPKYADLGKSSRDLFSKGYNFGFLKLDTTTKSGQVEFKTGASHNSAANALSGNIELKYKVPDYGLTLTEKWNTNNILGTEVEVQDKLAKGLKLTLNSAYDPAKAKRSGKAGLDFGHERVRATLDASVEPSPVLQASAVAEHEGWLLGVAAGYDSAKGQVKNSALSLGRSIGDYSLHTFINDGTEFGGNVYHRVNGKMELGANVGWKTGANATSFGIATKYQFQPETVLQAKLNNQSEIAAAMVHDLSDGFKLTLSAMCSLKGFQEGGHQFGIGLEYKP